MRDVVPSSWFERIGPSFAATPLVCAVPHAGRHYPPDLLRTSAVARDVLEELEDRHADLLIGQALEKGAVAIVARVARAWIDLNRGEDDLDPALRDPPGSGLPMTARARSGLGLLPSRIGRRELWRQKPSAAEAAHRIAAVHRPYHAAITDALADAVHHHGFAVLIDCHSMPPLRGIRPTRIVIGDHHGRTAGPHMGAELARLAREAGFPAALNAPYAGAHGVERHGRPAAGVHAIQVEIDRTLYLQPDLRTISAGIAQVCALVAALGDRAVAIARPDLAIAAE